jgi:hypothetical protein
MFGNGHRNAALAALVLAGGAVVASAQAPAMGIKAVPAAFEKFKALAGDWVAAEDGEMSKKGDLVARYAVTAAGTAVVETVFPGSPHEMVTVYHPDGRDVVLTHFCMEGNQPRMRAKGAQGPRFDFAFEGGTNIDPKRDRHMHQAILEFLGVDEIRTEWTELAEGKPVLVVKSHLVRRAN